MTRMLAAAAVVAAVGGALAVSPTTSVAQAASVPAATAEGPIAGVAPGDASHDYPFLASPLDLAARGYVEEEYFVSGEACRYNGVGLTTATVRDCGFAYTTRILVRRPLSPAAFNGTVLAEWQNVTAQYDIDSYWLESSEHIMREGYVWVGISAQRAGVEPVPDPAVGVNTLTAWSPSRYASLNVTAGGTILDDALSYDIFSQAVQALRAPSGTDPLGALDPEFVIGLGTSQSGGRLAAYHNSIWPLYEPVIDAFFIGEARSATRTDLPVPVLRLLSEVDASAPFARPDESNYRHWEVAGTSHADAGFIENIVPLLDRDDVVRAGVVCARNPLSRIPKRYVYHAAWDHMVTWLRTGNPPPIAPRLERTATGAIARDDRGNALGGIRLSEHEVATAYNGAGNSGSLFCSLFGVHEPFAPEVLAGLYRNHGSYVSRVARANAANVRAGFLVAADSAESTGNAAGSTVGKP
jgi:hypothetical protein